jgi:hypothetical protein
VLLNDAAIVPVQPTREALHALRDREATARLELEECRHAREAMAVWMLQDGASVRTMRDVLDLTHNRIAALRRAVGAYPPVVEDRAARVVRIAAELGSDNVAAIARRAGASLSYTYRVLHEEPADAIEQAKMNGARVRERLLTAKQPV